uniref:C3H1-type domain-containing protein n=1 Tax=Talaromyces marneffei PM1 TaxID=1077442 RepID=A0A093V0F0_TALMA
MISGIHAQALFKRYEQLKLVELSKNDLIEDLLRRVSELEDAYHQVKVEHEPLSNYETSVSSDDGIQQDREPFVIVLLDGDKTLFLDQYIRAGEQGGKDAANKLAADLGEYVSEHLPNVASPKIVVRIFANVKGLGNTYHQAAIIDKTLVMDDFVRGFNESGLLFDFIDVGQGKGSAEDKISGFSHKNGCTELLQETMEDIDLTGRVSLIESIPSEKELDDLKASFRITQFSGIFRSTEISSSPIASVKTPVKTQNAMLSPHPRSASLTRTSTNTSTSSATPTSWSSWASVTASNPGDVTLQSLKPASAAAPKTPVVERNKLGQRIDRMDFKSVSKEELSRIKKMKLCNLYFLLGECPNTNCYHDHDYKLSKEEKDVLRAVARMTPCHFGMTCDDPKCIYGHRCPQSETGRRVSLGQQLSL